MAAPQSAVEGARGHLCDRPSLGWSAPVPVWCSEAICLPHCLLDSRASCKHPKASSLLWLLPPRVIDGGNRGQQSLRWVWCLPGCHGGLVAIKALPLLTCLECASLGPAVLCCLSPLASYQALIVRVTPPGPLMPLVDEHSNVSDWGSLVPVAVAASRMVGWLPGAFVWGTVSVSRADSSPLWVHTVCPCVDGPPALRFICAHCHSASRAGQCSHQGCCQGESSATTSLEQPRSSG